MCRDRSGYWQRDHYDRRFGGGYRSPADGDNDWNRNRDYGNDHGNYGVLAPNLIARSLSRKNYSAITRPVLSGQFYQVKAIDPRGRNVKLYVDAYSGQIVKTKGR